MRTRKKTVTVGLRAGGERRPDAAARPIIAFLYDWYYLVSIADCD